MPEMRLRTALHQTPLLDLRGPTSKGRGGEGRERRGGEGRGGVRGGGGGRGGEGGLTPTFLYPSPPLIRTVLLPLEMIFLTKFIRMSLI